MSTKEKYVTVDDTDPSITWNGSWLSTQGNAADWDDHSPPFLGTLRGISADGSLAFSFRGTSVSVWGSFNSSSSMGARNIVEQDLNWDCILDGTISGIKGNTLPSTHPSNVRLCLHDDLPYGDHAFELRATVRSEMLWVDRIQYRTSIDTDVSSGWTEVQFDDARYRYSNGWETRPYGRVTWTNNASFMYEFDGRGIVFGGYTLAMEDARDGLAAYSLDSGPLVEFRIPASTQTKGNQSYFEITPIQPGRHQLVVFNRGNASNAPLGISHIYTQVVGEIGDGAAAVFGGTRDRRVKSIIIGGAVAGGLVLILLVALLGWFCRRRRRRERARLATLLAPSAFDTEAIQRAAVPSTKFHTDLSDPGIRELVAPLPVPVTQNNSSRFVQSHIRVHVPAQSPRSNTPPPSYASF